MKTVVILVIYAAAFFTAPPPSIAADRDAADRQTRQESDELRADMRQQRLKKVKDLDNPGRQQTPNSEKSKTTEPEN